MCKEGPSVSKETESSLMDGRPRALALEWLRVMRRKVLDVG